MMEFIDTGIAIPKKRHGRPKSQTRLLAEQMAVGDSMLVSKHKSVVIWQYARVSGKKMTQRNEGDLVRVWRIA